MNEGLAEKKALLPQCPYITDEKYCLTPYMDYLPPLHKDLELPFL